ncbi:hypothetical protein X474_21530 [Dethiosulfatarculus sandiegensis]|uniref:Uncharacterized protein n=1 Tax=Dethiosulfatarculus sandiegensis TaxID=1429043 RepID=A0A0D2J1B4_9BACT|nr:hypothetical protein X474_21530 [Dethiosulfatarculus sandiegensis]
MPELFDPGLFKGNLSRLCRPGLNGLIQLNF